MHPIFRLQEDMLRALSPLLNGQVGALRQVGVFPSVNIYDDGNTFVVRAEVPGIDKDKLEITAQGDQLTVRGERRVESAESGASYHRREREGGSFRRVVTLPQPVDSDRISAKYKDGVLEISLPRLPEQQPRKIAVHC